MNVIKELLFVFKHNQSTNNKQTTNESKYQKKSKQKKKTNSNMYGKWSAIKTLTNTSFYFLPQRYLLSNVSQRFSFGVGMRFSL